MPKCAPHIGLSYRQRRNGLDGTPMADSRINDPTDQMHSLID